MIMGNDISKYQGDIAWDVYKNNSNFVIIKSSEGFGYTDPKFYQNQSEARRVGLPLGYYHFARPDLGNSPEKEASWFLGALGGLREGEFLCLDYEVNWNGNVVSWCKRFLDCLCLSGETNGIKSFIYLNQALIKAHDWSPVVTASYPLWVAAYTYDPNNNNFVTGAWSGAAMQQWTNKQTVPGITGEVDGNAFFGTVESLKRYGYRTPEPPEPPAPPVEPPEPPEITCEEQIKVAVDRAILDRDLVWQKTLESANQTIQAVCQQNFSEVPWKVLLSWGWKNFWKSKKSL